MTNKLMQDCVTHSDIEREIALLDMEEAVLFNGAIPDDVLRNISEADSTASNQKVSVHIGDYGHVTMLRVTGCGVMKMPTEVARELLALLTAQIAAVDAGYQSVAHQERGLSANGIITPDGRLIHAAPQA